MNERIEIEIQSPPRPKDEERRQIVEQNKPLNDDLDDDAKYLSAFNQKVTKQTRAAAQGEFQNTHNSTKSAPQPETTPPAPKQNATASKDKGESRRGLPSLASLKPQFRPSQQAQQVDDSTSERPVNATDDYLKDVEVGMQTMLSTREFVYYSYYTRIKERLKQNWEPTIREKVKMVFRQGRAIASTKDHITQVVVTLDANGELIKVDVIAPSGVEVLDDAAIEAFQKSQPFPNPPKGLIEKDGTIRIHWDFVLEANSTTPFQIHNRYAKGGKHAADSLSGL